MYKAVVSNASHDCFLVLKLIACLSYALRVLVIHPRTSHLPPGSGSPHPAAEVRAVVEYEDLWPCLRHQTPGTLNSSEVKLLFSLCDFLTYRIFSLALESRLGVVNLWPVTV